MIIGLPKRPHVILTLDREFGTKIVFPGPSANVIYFGSRLLKLLPVGTEGHF